MLHQTGGRAEGQAQDIKVKVSQILKIRDSIIGIYSRNTGKSCDVLKKDLERDFWLNAEEAVEYGIVDRVIKKSVDEE